MAKYRKHPRPEPTDENWLVTIMLLGPLAWPLRWLWRAVQGWWQR